MIVEHENKFKKDRTILSFKKKRGLLLKPKTWCKISFKTDNSILMVFCDREYEYSDYIENYKDLELDNIINKTRGLKIGISWKSFNNQYSVIIEVMSRRTSTGAPGSPSARRGARKSGNVKSVSVN